MRSWGASRARSTGAARWPGCSPPTRKGPPRAGPWSTRRRPARRRTLDELLPAYEEETDTRADMEYELALLARRIRLIMWSLGLAVLSALLICMLIGVAFISAYFEARLAGAAVAILFTASILA